MGKMICIIDVISIGDLKINPIGYFTRGIIHKIGSYDDYSFLISTQQTSSGIYLKPLGKHITGKRVYFNNAEKLLSYISEFELVNPLTLKHKIL